MKIKRKEYNHLRRIASSRFKLHYVQRSPNGTISGGGILMDVSLEEAFSIALFNGSQYTTVITPDSALSYSLELVICPDVTQTPASGSLPATGPDSGTGTGPRPEFPTAVKAVETTTASGKTDDASNQKG